MRISLNGSAALLYTIGTVDFGRSLMAVAHEMVAADYCSLFLFKAQAPPVCLVSSGLKSDRLAYYAADKYVTVHWRHDPVIEPIKDKRRTDRLLVSGLNCKLSDSHQRDCMETLNIGDRFTFLFGNRSQFLRLSFYRYLSNANFGVREINILHTATDFFQAAATRHHRLLSRAGIDYNATTPSPEAMRQRLVALNSTLSPREVEVCAMVLRGFSTEGIALEIGIGQSSVTTYRKRAYRKLGIATQNELFAACLSMN